MRFQLAYLLALVPFVAAAAVPSSSTDVEFLTALPEYSIITLSPEAVGSEATLYCLAIVMEKDFHYLTNITGLPGCSAGRYNRVSLPRWKKRKKGKICPKIYPANSSTYSVSAAYRQLGGLCERGTGLS